VRRERSAAFAPGRVNLIGEHTDYNGGLALPFAIAQGVTVRARALAPEEPARIEAHAVDLGERETFLLGESSPASGWRAFVRGTVTELLRSGHQLAGGALEIRGEVPRGAGLSSSAALSVALCLALIELGATQQGEPESEIERVGASESERLEIARLCSRVENEWVGAHTGLLDQLACLFGAPDQAVCIDFATLAIEPVALSLGRWRLFVLDSKETHMHAGSGYNERRAECARACELLGVSSLSEADAGDLGGLPEPLRHRASHVLGENERVREAVAALRAGELATLGALLNASQESQRDLYEVSTPAIEAVVEQVRAAGAAGARMIGGGFGGSVLGLFPPGADPPAAALEVHPSAGAHLLDA
jgi:galactokinase